MTLVEVLVPTKITLFGEHAVVYGIPAIASTIPVYIRIIGKRIDENIVKIRIEKGIQIPSQIFVVKRDENVYEVLGDQNYTKKVLQYIIEALNLCEERLGLNTRSLGYDISIESSLPQGIGLGTSAAISVGITTLCMALNNYIINFEEQKYEIAEISWNVEKRVQGSASPMDTFTISLGGLRYIEPLVPAAHLIDINYEIPLLIGYTNRVGTTAELICKVKLLREKNENLFNSVLNTIKQIVEKAKDAIKNGDIETLGILMNINHGLLRALGVVNLEHDLLTHILLKAGALGVKTSGAGNGGAFIVLAPSEESLKNLAFVAESLGAKIVAKGIVKEGVKFYIR